MNGLGRPTATVTRVDLSSERRASAVPASPVTEADLWRAYAGESTVIESRPCACGGVVQADPALPARGVAAHQFTSRHKAWRSAMGLDA